MKNLFKRIFAELILESFKDLVLDKFDCYFEKKIIKNRLVRVLKEIVNSVKNLWQLFRNESVTMPNMSHISSICRWFLKGLDSNGHEKIKEITQT